MATFERQLIVGKTDNFTLTLDSNYLSGESITTADAQADNANLTVNSVAINGGVISASCTGNVEGETELEFEWTTATRSGCVKHVVVIAEC